MKRYLAITLVMLFACTASLTPAKRSKHPGAKKLQAVGPKVTKIDVDGLKGLLKPNGKALLINFWATWCDPCKEEFPELVKLDRVYNGKVDFVTVSLDDVDDIGTAVPKFLGQMKSTMPAYLLAAADEDLAISTIAGISSDFHGSLPFTLLMSPNGEVAYSRQGKINPSVLNTELAKQLPK